MPAKVLLTDYAWPDLELERVALNEAGFRLIVADNTDEASLAAAAQDVDAIMTTWVRITESVLRAATRCRIVSRMGIGLDNIDVDCCTKLGIPVTNVPDYCTIEVVEHTLALLLAVARNIPWFITETRQQRYDLSAAPPMKRVEGQTLGIVGMGRIGRLLAQKAQGLGLKIIASTRNPRPAADGITYRSLDDLLRESDFVSLHVPLTADTRRLLGRREFDLMKSTAWLINTSRGGLIDHAALAEVLARGGLAGAALDVQDPEPPDLTQPPYNDPRVVITPHAAFVSRESLIDLRTRSVQQVITRLNGGVPENVVNFAGLNEAVWGS